MEQSNTSTMSSWLLFLVSTVATIALLILKPEWFWVTLPFMLTYLVKAMRAM